MASCSKIRHGLDRFAVAEIQVDTGHRDALVLVTSIGPSTGEGTAPCPSHAPPRTRLLPDLTADGF
jgi:hypothetical protein